VPEAERVAQVEGEQERADRHRGERDQEREPRRSLVARIAEQPEQGADQVGAPGEAAQEEVPDDVPLPLRRGDEVLGHG